MKDGPSIARIAALIGDHARAEVLTALMADRALTATELGALAGVGKATMSAHLTKLLDAGLLAVEAQGRHRYFRLSGPDVAHLLESLMGVAFRTGAVRARSGPREPALRHARVCYDHLAGEQGVRVYEALQRKRWLQGEPQALRLTPAGQAALSEWGLDIEALQTGRRSLCRACLDWSERRHHLAGALGAALLERFSALGWADRRPDSRVVQFSAAGERQLQRWLG
jgi:DNA-binding transcriptional ArsR family regulator